MTDLVALATAGLGLGLLHSLEPDHLAAMSTLVGKRTRSTLVDALRGAAWGLGHTLALGSLGLLLAVAGTQIPGWWECTLEICVGMLLIWLGILRLRDPIPDQHPHHHGHAPLWIGILHGAAGSGAVLILAPAVFVEDPMGYLAYILAFGLGSILSMSAFCAGLGEVLNRLRFRTAAAGRWFAAIAGSLGITVGMIWVVRATL